MLCYVSQYLLRTSFSVGGTATVTKAPQYRLEFLPAPLPNSTLPFSLGITELLMPCCKHKKASDLRCGKYKYIGNHLNFSMLFSAHGSFYIASDCFVLYPQMEKRVREKKRVKRTRGAGGLTWIVRNGGLFIYRFSLYGPYKAPEFKFVDLLRSPGIDSQPGGIDSLESSHGFLKRLRIWLLTSDARIWDLCKTGDGTFIAFDQ